MMPDDDAVFDIADRMTQVIHDGKTVLRDKMLAESMSAYMSLMIFALSIKYPDILREEYFQGLSEDARSFVTEFVDLVSESMAIGVAIGAGKAEDLYSVLMPILDRVVETAIELGGEIDET